MLCGVHHIHTYGLQVFEECTPLPSTERLPIEADDHRSVGVSSTRGLDGRVDGMGPAALHPPVIHPREGQGVVGEHVAEQGPVLTRHGVATWRIVPSAKRDQHWHVRRLIWRLPPLQFEAEHVEKHIRPHLSRTRVGPRCGCGADLKEGGGPVLPWTVMRDLQADLKLRDSFVVGIPLERTPKRGESRRRWWCFAGSTSVGRRCFGFKVWHANRMNGQARPTACRGVFGEEEHVFDLLPCGVRPSTVEVILVEVKSGTAPNTNSTFEVGRR